MLGYKTVTENFHRWKQLLFSTIFGHFVWLFKHETEHIDFKINAYWIPASVDGECLQ